MNKVITINLNGVAYQLEEGGYDALRAYLDNAARRLEGNPDKDEIITDIEQAIAEKFRALLGANKTVVNVKEVTGVLDEMGPVEGNAFNETAGQGAAGTNSAASAPEASEAGGVRKLYRIYPEGAMLSGVCNGLGAYFGLDPTLFRIVFVLLTFLWTIGIWAYVVLVLLIPRAKTTADKAAATGAGATTTQEFIKRAREGYYEGMRSFHDKDARRAWKRKFKRDMRSWKYGFHQQMNEHAHHWRAGWQGQPGQAQPPIFGPVFIAPLLSILLFGLVILTVWAIYTVVTAHAVFGFALPTTMPLWVGILLVVVAYQLLAWPLKSMRLACYYPSPNHLHGGLLGGLIGSLIGLFFLGFGIWMLDRHVPEFHAWMVQLPDLLHRFAETVRSWFTQKG